MRHGARQLEAWATKGAATTGLDWWEWAGGAAASVLAIHALLSAAADAETTPAQALQIDHAYLLSSALTTMLDSVIDDDAGEATGSHRYISYYGTRKQPPVGSRGLPALPSSPHAAYLTPPTTP